MRNATTNPLITAFSDPTALRALCGRQIRYRGECYQVTDVLWEDGLLILHANDRHEVQEDSFGRPSRVVPAERRIAIHNEDGSVSSIWQELELIE